AGPPCFHNCSLEFAAIDANSYGTHQAIRRMQREFRERSNDQYTANTSTFDRRNRGGEGLGQPRISIRLRGCPRFIDQNERASKRIGRRKAKIEVPSRDDDDKFESSEGNLLETRASPRLTAMIDHSRLQQRGTSHNRRERERGAGQPRTILQ